MHHALLIDEILHHIFSFCADTDRPTLGKAALTCRAWKDPALDHLWRHLSSIKPFLDLIPGVVCKSGTYGLVRDAPSSLNSGVLRYYARRVRHIAHRHSLQLRPTLLHMLTSIWDDHETVFPCLTSVRASSLNAFPQTIPLSISTHLRQLDLDLGFKRNAQSSDDVCDYLQQVAPRLHKLSIRGAMSTRMNAVVASMFGLRLLSLRTRSSLTIETLIAISAFPLLEDLDVHAGHLSGTDFLNYVSSCSAEGLLFPSLHSLRIRGEPALVDVLLSRLPHDRLSALHIEALSQSTNPWTPIFSTVKTRASNSLHDLTLEHHIDDLDLDTIIVSAQVDEEVNRQLPRPDFLTLSHLTPLSHLHHLRRLTFNTTVPPLMCDADADALVKWWPEITHLDLGTVFVGDCNAPPSPFDPKLTLSSLATFAIGMMKLQALTLPIDLSVPPPFESGVRKESVLQRLVMSSTAAPKADPLVPYLAAVFPMLEHVEGGVGYDEAWVDVQASLREVRLL